MNPSVKKTAGKIEKLFKEDKRFFGFYADYLSEIGDKGKALKILKENINFFPDYSTGELVLGEIFFKLKKFDQAEMLFKGALKKDKTCVKALKYLAGLEEIKGNKNEQLEIIKELLRYDPFDQDAKNIIQLNDNDLSMSLDYEEPESVFEQTAVCEISEDSEGMEEKVQDRDSKEKLSVQTTKDTLDKLDSSDDIEIPEISFAGKEDSIEKNKFSEEVLNKEKSFS
ncbi:MAG: hypothetical protein KKD38_05840, partial [Candidatus Delongbacteria bacterium]|nr:hypothetical protein [Candidatus Delongbacteria bacterium]MCG2760569.1 hypothetical protein [Candidatus Delongbacteria bacterium]